MRSFLIATLVASLFLVVGGSTAGAGNLKSFEGASWYEKYLAVTTPEPLPCTSNAGEAQQLTFPGNPPNVDASHECGSQSETFIAINPANPNNVVAGSNEIQRLPMRAMSPSMAAADLHWRRPAAAAAAHAERLRLRLRPGSPSTPTERFTTRYIIVFFCAGGSINGTEMAVARSSDGGVTWTATYFAPQTGSGQFNDKPMITVDTGTCRSSPQPHLRRLGQRDRKLVIREERQQRRPVVFG